jgi:hypothetical protein
MQDDRKYWLDDMGNVKKVLYALYIACAVLIALDFTYTKHTMFGFEGWWGFYGIYGFVACVLLVLCAKVLRVLISRPLDYYGDDGGDTYDR